MSKETMIEQVAHIVADQINNENSFELLKELLEYVPKGVLTTAIDTNNENL